MLLLVHLDDIKFTHRFPYRTPDGRIPGGAALFFKIQLLEVLSAGIGGGPKLVGSDGKELKKNDGGGLLGADGKPL